MSVYLDSYIIEANLAGSTWTDITSDVIIEAIAADWGITDNTAVDLVADAGSMTFTLNNIGDEYIPGHTSATAGWAINTPVRLKCTFQGIPYYLRFYVSGLDVISEKFNRKKIRVSCVDYIEYMARTPLRSQSVAAAQTADQGITTLVALMQTAPQSTSYQTGQETFNTIFTSVSPRTRIYGEVAKLAKSEFGYFYNSKDQANGETLVFDSNQTRSGLNTLTEIQQDSGDVLLLETGDKLLLETGDDLLLNQAATAPSFDNSMKKVDIQYGEDIVNYFKVTANPTTVTAGASTLWELGEPIEMGAAEIITFRTNYRDPAGGNQINCLTSEATGTTKAFRPNYDGTGANMDANLNVATVFGTEGVTFTLTNNATVTGYVTTLTATGTGLQIYSSVFKETESAVSQLSYDLRQQSINQAYQQDPDLGILMGGAVIEKEKEPRLDLQKITFNANRSVALMHAFLEIDVGNLVHIKEDDAEIDGYYYIQGKELTINPGGVIDFSWVVRGMNSLISGGLTPVTIEFGGDGSFDRMDFGRIPYITNDKTRTYTAWVYIAPTDTKIRSIMGTYAASTGTYFCSENDKLEFFTFNVDGTFGVWLADDVHASNTWMHVGVTHDVSASALADPIFYINGSSIAITEISTPVGAYESEKGSIFAVGGVARAGSNNPMDGKIADPRVYSTILTSGNMTTLYNGGNPDASLLTSGLVFQGFNVRTKDYSGLLDATLTATDKLTDNMFGIVGTPNAGEILRVFP